VRQRESALRIGVQSQRDYVQQREHARHDLNAPTGHWPPAQGWRASAYLGSSFNKSSTATRLWRMSCAMDGWEWPQPRGGWESFADHDPG